MSKSKKKVASKAKEKTVTKVTEAESEAVNEDNKLTLSIPKLLDVVGGALYNAFVSGEQEAAKKIFKKLKKEKKIVMGSVDIAEKLNMKLNLGLHYSEFQGPGFNFHLFRDSLASMLEHIRKVLKEKGDLKLLTSDNNEMLFNLPGLIEKDGQFNTMVVILDPTVTGELTINLTYVDPNQYVGIKNA